MKDEPLKNNYSMRKLFLICLYWSFLISFAQPKIGAFYFDGWTQAQWNNYTKENFDGGAYKKMLINDFSEREPAYGWVTSTPDNIVRQINDAAEAQLDFFIFDWYYCEEVGYEECFMNNALKLFMKAENRNKLSFCSMITNDTHNIGPQEWTETIDNLLKQFSNSAYFKVDDRPLVLIYLGDKMIDAFGKRRKMDKALLQLKKESIKNGLGTPLIGIMNISKKNFRRMKNVDFISMYNDPTAALRLYGDTTQREFLYDDLQKGEFISWEYYLEFVNRKKSFVPTVTSSWDDRPWVGKDSLGNWNTNLWYERATPEEFKQSILNAHYFNTYYLPNSYDLIFINAWNEYGEGSYISKMKNGEFMGEAIKQVKKMMR